MYSTNSTCVGYSSSIMYLLYHDISQERETLVLFSVRGISSLFPCSDARRTHIHPPHPDNPAGPNSLCRSSAESRVINVLAKCNVLAMCLSRLLLAGFCFLHHSRDLTFALLPLQCSADSECVGTTVPGMLTSPRRKAQTKTCAGYIQPLAWEDQDFQTPKPSPQTLSASTPQSGA